MIKSIVKRITTEFKSSFTSEDIVKLLIKESGIDDGEFNFEHNEYGDIIGASIKKIVVEAIPKFTK